MTSQMLYESWSAPDVILGALQDRFRSKDLEQLYRRYEQRAHIGVFFTYLCVQSVLSAIYLFFIFLACWQKPDCDPVSHLLLSVTNFGGQCFVLLSCIICLIFVLRSSGLLRRRPGLLFCYALFVAIVMEAVDVGRIIKYSLSDANESHAHVEHLHSRTPVLSIYNHVIIYLFLPIRSKRMALFLGMFASTVCVSTFVVLEMYALHNSSTTAMRQALADILFFSCLNLAGLYIRYVGEINLRRGFLDKRACIDSTFRLRFEKEQEENLLASIIPKHMATQVRDAIWSYLESHRVNEARTPFKELFVERHEQVSILFADICKFTELATTLAVDRLVATLNDLFGKFDEAAERHKCMRIKILGDCYYCVSGMPNWDSRHAANCVHMGLEMIALIGEVRREHRVPVNMRIGVHSGHLLSGIIGLKKWQYDIWSKHVTIANRMEATGEPGAVHITEETRSALPKDEFMCLRRASISNDEVLKDVKSYLIYPSGDLAKNRGKLSTVSNVNNATKPEMRLARSDSLPSRPSKPTSARRTASTRKANASSKTDPEENTEETEEMSRPRGSLLMLSSLKSFQQMVDSAGEFMRDEIERLPLWRPSQILGEQNVFSCVPHGEKARVFLKESDPLFKFYVLASFVLLVVMALILLVTAQHLHLLLWLSYTLLFVLLCLLLPCLWVSYVWERVVDPHCERDRVPEPDEPFLRMLYRASKRIAISSGWRIAIFAIVSLLAFASVVFDLTTASCMSECPRNYTYRCALALMIMFMFLRIHHLLKPLATLLCLVTFSAVILKSGPDNVFATDSFGFEELFTGEDQKASHLVFLVVFSLLFFLMEQQHEHMHRLDFDWKQQLKREENQARETRLVNKMLLRNILPHHVADIYLEQPQTQGKLYSESYSNVAVMFASMPDFMDFFNHADNSDDNGGVVCLQILNEIFAAFDKLLFENEFAGVEKIKVIGSTYMAACGLLPGRRASCKSRRVTSGFDEYNDLDFGYDNNDDEAGANVSTMARFGAAMIRELQFVDFDKFETITPPNFTLRIGLSEGEVIAGVIGVSKPLYDIWGNTVNVASRMDYTGIPGAIQVPEKAAQKLMNLNVSCTFRDVVNVKGKGPMHTYLVDLDDDCCIKEINEDPKRKDEEKQKVGMRRLGKLIRESRKGRKARCANSASLEESVTMEHEDIEDTKISQTTIASNVSNECRLEDTEDKHIRLEENTQQKEEVEVRIETIPIDSSLPNEEQSINQSSNQSDLREENPSIAVPRVEVADRDDIVEEVEVVYRDSGYGSQGQLKVDEGRVARAMEDAMEAVATDSDKAFYAEHLKHLKPQ